MDISTATGASRYVRGFAGKDDWEFPLLTMEDFGSLQRRVPVPEREQALLTLQDLYRYANTPDGACHVLLLSYRKHRTSLTLDEVRGWDCIAHRCQLARVLCLDSFFNGEEPENTPKGKAGSPATTS